MPEGGDGEGRAGGGPPARSSRPGEERARGGPLPGPVPNGGTVAGGGRRGGARGRAFVRSVGSSPPPPARGGTANPAPSGREPSPPRAALPHPSGPLGGGPRRRAAGGDSIRAARHVVSRRSRRFSFLFVATTASSRRASAAGVAFVAIRRPRRAAGNDRGSGGLTSVDRDLNGRSATHSTTFRFESSTGDLGAHRGT